MSKIYRLLRNNIETGPFDMDELVQLQLRPKDLVWKTGTGACWQYPEEIDELRTFLSGPDPSSSGPRTLSSAPEMITATIEQPVALQQDEDEPNEEKLRARAEALYKKIQAFKEKKPEEIETKYSRSLDDLKNEYSEWMHSTKKKRTFPAGWLLLTFLIVAGALGIVYFRSRSPLIGSSESKGPEVPAIQNVDVSPVKKSTAKKTKSSSGVDKYLDSIRDVMRAQDKTVTVAVNRAKKKARLSSTINTPVVQTPAQKPVEKNNIEPVTMESHCTYDAGQGVDGVEVTLRNNGNDLIRTAAVQVLFYKKGERLFDRTTILFTNIAPGRSLTVSRPGNKKAVAARFELGAVSLQQ
jgi:hypothetical protein